MLAAKERKEHSAAKPQPSELNGLPGLNKLHEVEEFARAAQILTGRSTDFPDKDSLAFLLGELCNRWLKLAGVWAGSARGRLPSSDPCGRVVS